MHADWAVEAHNMATLMSSPVTLLHVPVGLAEQTQQLNPGMQHHSTNLKFPLHAHLTH
jgi:hypothetical protein